MSSETVKVLTLGENSRRRHLLLRNPLFQKMPSTLTDKLAEMACERRLPDRAVLHRKGDQPDGIYLVIEGCIRATSSAPDGREALLALLEPGTSFGESSALEGSPRGYDASAQGDTWLLVIPTEKLTALLEAQPELYRYFIPLLCQRIRLSTLLLESNALQSLKERLARRLLLISQNMLQGRVEEPRGMLHLSQEALSQMLGTSRQSINKVLGELEKDGLVERQYGCIKLRDMAALQHLATPG
ncbi:MAG TPA: Crp/Fnr family transcriptional regulator [Noviherbaspirillum sp.]|uniref:Crp/Fnr family transcriptional regulator n=1 Tax=Noviherbaspirillum sp. TaxID=1926288 RepID=UPI002B45EDA0|nr:Crp/Fnr family transcriptional regulator [Noviherbaspirillum sp.]HJV84583.1 Crp/Fnr family transcriptional regulator [Noviherbaspirillum sp.]